MADKGKPLAETSARCPVGAEILDGLRKENEKILVSIMVSVDLALQRGDENFHRGLQRELERWGKRIDELCKQQGMAMAVAKHDIMGNTGGTALMQATKYDATVHQLRKHATGLDLLVCIQSIRVNA